MDNQRIDTINNLILRAKRYFAISPIGNLTLNEISSMVTIYHGAQKKGSDLNMSEAGELLDLCRSATSQLVARLERKGMLSRELVLCDRRKTLVKLTPKGKKIVNDLEEDRIKGIQCAINILGEESADQFIELFERYMNVLEGERKDA